MNKLLGVIYIYIYIHIYIYIYTGYQGQGIRVDHQVIIQDTRLFGTFFSFVFKGVCRRAFLCVFRRFRYRLGVVLGDFSWLVWGLWDLAGLHSLLHENLLFEVLEDTRSSTFPCFFRRRFQTVFLVVFSAHFLILGSPLASFGRFKASFFDKLWWPGRPRVSRSRPRVSKRLTLERFWCHLRWFLTYFAYIWGACLCGHILHFDSFSVIFCLYPLCANSLDCTPSSTKTYFLWFRT